MRPELAGPGRTALPGRLHGTGARVAGLNSYRGRRRNLEPRCRRAPRLAGRNTANDPKPQVR